MAREALETQEGGTHYKEMKIQPIEYAMANGFNMCEGNILKYISRHRRKNGREDLEKAKHMIDLLIALEYDTRYDCADCDNPAPQDRMIVRT